MRQYKNHRIIRSEEVQEILTQSIQKLNGLIGNCYGPFGKNILMDKKKSVNLELLKDGSTIIKNLRTADQTDDLIFLMLEDAFQKINITTGDGTKTFFLLMSYLILNGFKYIIQNSSTLEVKVGIAKSLNYALLILSEKSTPITSKNIWNKLIERYIPEDENLQPIIKQAFEKIGRSGQLKIKTENGKKTELNIERGMQIERGFFSSYFITDTEKMLVDFQHPYILICGQKISISEGYLLPILETLIYEKRPIVIISTDIDEQSLSTLILNKVNGILDLAYIKVPQNFTHDQFLLEDLALYTNAKLIKSNIEWKNFDPSYLGQAEKILITKSKTIFWSKSLAQEKIIQNKCKELKQQILFSDSDYENEKRENRRKNFSASTAILTIGGITEVEINDRYLRTEKGLISARSCTFEGIIPNSSFSFIQLIEELENWSRTNLCADETLGSNLVIKSLMQPIKFLIQEQSESRNIIPKYLKSIYEIKKINNIYQAYDLKLEKIVDFIESKNIDCFKSLRIGLQTTRSLTYSILSIANIII